MYGNCQILQQEKSLREKKEYQYKIWKLKNPHASSKRKRDAKWVKDMTSTVNSDYNEGIFDGV